MNKVKKVAKVLYKTIEFINLVLSTFVLGFITWWILNYIVRWG
jgi:hypothetical protein